MNKLRSFVNLLGMTAFRLRFDKSFRLDEFQIGAKRAFVVVSKKLHSSDFDGLRGLVSDQTLDRLRPLVERLPDKHREMLDIGESDIHLLSLLRTGFEKNKTGEKFFEMLLAFLCFRRTEEYRQQIPKMDLELLRNPDRLVLANMKFAKRLTPIVDSDWTVTEMTFAHGVEMSGFRPPSK